MSNNKKEEHIFICLHCGEPFIIAKKDFNCKILRHGVMKDTLRPMDPHASKETCEEFVQKGLIYGCGKPMRILQKSSDEYVVEICEYV
jgi:hypothetical protein